MKRYVISHYDLFDNEMTHHLTPAKSEVEALREYIQGCYPDRYHPGDVKEMDQEEIENQFFDMDAGIGICEIPEEM